MRETLSTGLEKVTFYNQDVAESSNDTKAGDPINPFRAMFNPTQFTERLSASYARHAVMGLSHQVMQFTGTSNLVVEMELYYRATTPDEILVMQMARRQLHSWLYPKSDAIDISGGGAPLILVVWPNMLNFQAHMTSVEFTHTKFHHSLVSTRYIARVVFEGVLINNISSAEVVADIGNRFDGLGTKDTGIGTFRDIEESGVIPPGDGEVIS